MKITKLETIPLRRPVENSFGGSQFNYDVGGHLLLRGLHRRGLRRQRHDLLWPHRFRHGDGQAYYRRELAPGLIGQDPHFVRKLRDDMHAATEYYGTIGVACMGVSAVDTALWDIIGQAAGVPTAFVLGARRTACSLTPWSAGTSRAASKNSWPHCEEAAEEGFSAV